MADPDRRVPGARAAGCKSIEAGGRFRIYVQADPETYIEVSTEDAVVYGGDQP